MFDFLSTDVVLAFVTGLTTGGLSCLAVQGGLLASSLASEMEKELQFSGVENQTARPHIARPILLFLLAKLAAYTLLGFLLGAMGMVLQLNLFTRALLQLGIGIFMVGNALRLFNVHPIFRYFNFEPPSSVTRYIRRRAKNGSSSFTPLFLGAMTVLIPCGITQAMMAAAMGTGNPVNGATLLFAFILGTSPVFFVVAYFTTRLGSVMEKYFMHFVAVVLLALGLFTINTGLNLMGSPFSVDNLLRSAKQSWQPTAVVEAAVQQPIILAASQATETILAPTTVKALPSPTSNASGGDVQQTALPADNGVPRGPNNRQSGGCGCGQNGNRPTVGPQPGPAQPDVTPLKTATPAATSVVKPGVSPTIASAKMDVLTINVMDYGYEPAVLHARAGIPIRLDLITKDTFSCALAFTIPDLGIEKMLPTTGVTSIELPAYEKGTIIPFSCSMGMDTGQIIFDR